MNGPMKNIDKAQVLVLRDQVAYQDGQIVSKTLAQNSNVSITLFSFERARKSAPTRRAATPLSPAWTARVKSPSTVKNTSCTLANPS